MGEGTGLRYVLFVQWPEMERRCCDGDLYLKAWRGAKEAALL